MIGGNPITIFRFAIGKWLKHGFDHEIIKREQMFLLGGISLINNGNETDINQLLQAFSDKYSLEEALEIIEQFSKENGIE